MVRYGLPSQPPAGVPEPLLGGLQQAITHLFHHSLDALVMACPAAVAQQWYNALAWCNQSDVHLRNLVFCVLAFRLFLRLATILSITQAEVVRVGDNWVFRYKPMSWKTGVASVGTLPVRSLDLSGFPLLRVALQQLLVGVPLAGCMWGSRGATTGEAAGWFTSVLATVTPAVLGQLTLYSCRRGGASAARAAGVPMDVIEVAGGWAMGSTALRRHYLCNGYF